MILGATDLTGADWLALGNDALWLSEVELERPGKLSKLSAYIDGGGEVGRQVFRGVVYDSDLALIGYGNEALLDSATGQSWVDLRFERDPALDLPAGTLYIGLHAGASANVCRVAVNAALSEPRYRITDTYSDGPAATISLPAAGDTLLVFATTFAHRPVPFATDGELARLDFPDAQVALGVGPPERASFKVASCEWHGTLLDEEVGSFAIVNVAGPLVDLVGERIRLRCGRRYAYAYVHRQTELDCDLSLTRRLFSALAPLASEDIIVDVQTVG